MKQQAAKAIVPSLAIAFILCAGVFAACDPCELEGEYSVALTDQPGAVHMHGSLWYPYTSADVRDTVMDALYHQFGSASNLYAVSTRADVHIFIDSIITGSYEWDESREDPCYGEHGWLYQAAFPPDITTFHLRQTEVTIIYTVVDSIHLKTGWGRVTGVNNEYLNLPPGDSTHCYPYEIAGSCSNRGAMWKAAQFAFHNFKCEIKKMMEP